MSHRKRTSEVLDEATKQLAEVELGPQAHLGNRLAIAAWAAKINEASIKLNEYNQMVERLEADRIELEASEAALHEKSEQILAATAAKYGIDSYEYKVVSGQIEPKRPRKKRTKAPRSA